MLTLLQSHFNYNLQTYIKICDFYACHIRKKQFFRGNIAIIQAIPKSYCCCCHWLSCADFQGRFFFRFSHGSCFELLSPLEKVPFATFYPRWKHLCGTYFSKKRLFQVDSLSEMFFEVKKSSDKQFKTASKFPQNPNKTLMENRHS